MCAAGTEWSTGIIFTTRGPTSTSTPKAVNSGISCIYINYTKIIRTTSRGYIISTIIIYYDNTKDCKFRYFWRGGGAWSNHFFWFETPRGFRGHACPAFQVSYFLFFYPVWVPNARKGVRKAEDESC